MRWLPLLLLTACDLFQSRTLPDGGLASVFKATPLEVEATGVSALPNGNLLVMSATAVSEVRPDGTVMESSEGAVDGIAGGFLRRGKNLYAFGSNEERVRSDQPIKAFAVGKWIQVLSANRLDAYDLETGALFPGRTVQGNISLIAVDAQDRVALFDFDNCRLTRDDQVLLGDGCALGAIQQGKLGQGLGMVFESNGDLIFSDTANHRVLRVTFGGATYALYEAADFTPTQLTRAADGTLFVVEAQSKKLVKLSP